MEAFQKEAWFTSAENAIDTDLRSGPAVHQQSAARHDTFPRTPVKQTLGDFSTVDPVAAFCQCSIVSLSVMSCLLLLKRSLPGLSRPLVILPVGSTRTMAKKPDKKTDKKTDKKGVAKPPQKPGRRFDEPEDTSNRDKNAELVIRCLDAPIIHPPPPSKEEAIRRYAVGRASNIGLIEMHNDREHDLACKIKIKMHAVNMLPKYSTLKEKALEEDDIGPPLYRPIPKTFPPIENFDPSIFQEDDDALVNRDQVKEEGHGNYMIDRGK